MHNVERPPFYHLPRSCPVAFEDPIKATRSSNKSSEIPTKLTLYEQDTRNNQSFNQSRMSNTLFKPQFVNLNSNNSSDVYNSLPKPFMRNQQRSDHLNTHYYQQQAANLYGRGGSSCGGGGGSSNESSNQHQQTIMMPKILVNDRSTSLPYPTSTVHKSMLNTSRSPVNHDVTFGGNNTGGVNYSRLISPTIASLPTSQSGQKVVKYESDKYIRSHQEGMQSHQQMARAVPRSIQDNPIEYIAAPEYLQLKSPESGNSSRSEEAREFLVRTLPSESSSSLSTSLVAPPTGAQSSSRLQIDQLKPVPQQLNNSNLVLPDNKSDEYMWNKQFERVSIAHQTYRTLPIVSPKPKARHDLPSGNYMRLNQDPSWDMIRSRSSSLASKDHERKIELAIKNNNEIVVSCLFR